jgi:serine/threonine protein kinase
MPSQLAVAPRSSGTLPGPLGVGAVLAGRYRVGRNLGPLDAATLYEGHDLQLSRPVSILCTSASPEDLPPLPPAPVSHVHLADVLDRGAMGGADFMVLERLHGDHLERRRLARPARALDHDEAVGFAIDALSALEHLHNRGQVHGALAPQDLWVTPGERLRLVIRPPGATASTARRAWMSPECLRGRHIDGRSDLYALGAVLYGLLLGRPPFGADPEMAEHGHLYASLPEADRLPQRLHAVIRRSMAKNPADRFPTAAAMGAALTALGHSSRYDAILESTHEDDEPTAQVPDRDGVPTLDVRPLVVHVDGRPHSYVPPVKVSDGWLDLEEQHGLRTEDPLPAFLGTRPPPGAAGRWSLAAFDAHGRTAEDLHERGTMRTSTAWSIPARQRSASNAPDAKSAARPQR